MKLRFDLLEHLRAEDIRKAAEESVHRFKPEPLFSKTGTRSLSVGINRGACQRGQAQHGLTRKLEARARKNGKRSSRKS